jgi:hypothetical protein
VAETRDLRDIVGRFMLATQTGFERMESRFDDLATSFDRIEAVLEQHTVRLVRIEERLG